ncbi:hypothetical protein RND81_06G149700 [Saponaria officinalis]|uniref:Epidermal patterning factor-like protein n=1 Tax=Saponaria officinalis TaxID=3572 RepID=A0AAW1KA25_SAPOF
MRIYKMVSVKRCYINSPFFLFCLLSICLLPLLSGGTTESRKMVIGSRPPRCTNKCMNCKPCTAVLVIPPHPLTPLEDETYYLLSWKCRCHNKLFQP